MKPIDKSPKLPEVLALVQQNIAALDEALDEAFEEAVTAAAEMAETLRLALLEEKRSFAWIQFATD
jgi:L-aminopeptidase/D-esterase-like protein